MLWKDRENFLRLERGIRGKHQVAFTGCLANEEILIGRGYLAVAGADSTPCIFLRLERRGHRVDALCSEDGVNWFTVGHVGFLIEGAIKVGLHTIGYINRLVYRGAYPGGTAIRFESF